MAKRKEVIVNTYFEGKPEWFRGYAETIAGYVIANNRVSDGAYSVVASPLSKHVADCGIAEIWNTDEETSMESSFDTFGNGDYASCFVSATVSCNCGEYSRVSASVQTTIAEIISSALYVPTSR